MRQGPKSWKNTLPLIASAKLVVVVWQNSSCQEIQDLLSIQKRTQNKVGCYLVEDSWQTNFRFNLGFLYCTGIYIVPTRVVQYYIKLPERDLDSPFDFFFVINEIKLQTFTPKIWYFWAAHARVRVRAENNQFGAENNCSQYIVPIGILANIDTSSKISRFHRHYRSILAYCVLLRYFN